MRCVCVIWQQTSHFAKFVVIKKNRNKKERKDMSDWRSSIGVVHVAVVSNVTRTFNVDVTICPMDKKNMDLFWKFKVQGLRLQNGQEKKQQHSKMSFRLSYKFELY